MRSKGWPPKRIDAILRAVLRASSYELSIAMCPAASWSRNMSMSRMPLSMATTGTVNAVLDQIARQFRADEFVRG
jgi:N utilization substance protein B